MEFKLIEFLIGFIVVQLTFGVIIPIIFGKPIYFFLRKNPIQQLEQRKKEALEKILLAQLEKEAFALEIKSKNIKDTMYDEFLDGELDEKKSKLL